MDSTTIHLRFLGTGTSTGIPVIGCDCEVCQSTNPQDKRSRSSIFIETSTLRLVVDTGPDFRMQMLRENIKNLDAVFFTHEHADHVLGLDDIRPINFIHNKDLPVYAEQRVHDALGQMFGYIYKGSPYPGVPRIIPELISEEPFTINGLEIIPIRAYHYKLPVLGFRFGNICYLTDAKTISEKEIDKMRGCEILVINALQETEHISHFTLEEAIALAEDVKPKKCYFTHVSHKMGPIAKVSAKLPDWISFAYDGLHLSSKSL